MERKKIKVGIFPNHKKIKATLDPQFQNPHNLSLVLDIWSNVNEKLSHKYDFETTLMKDYNYDNAIKEINNEKYDIVIGAFFPSQKRRKLVDFTEVFLICRPIIIYSPVNKKTQLKRYTKYLLSILTLPMIFLLILSFIFGFFAYVFKQESPVKGNISIVTSIYYIIAGFLGQSAGVLSITKLKETKNIILGIITFMFIYFFGVYVTASTTAKSVSYLQRDYKIEYTIKDMRILAYPGEVSRLVSKNGGIPILLPKNQTSIQEYYLNNKKKLKLDGYIWLPFNRVDDIESSGLNISKVFLKYYHTAFPINKKHNHLKRDINETLREMQDNDKLFNACKLWTDKRYVMC
jgi:ABC-type amino acid transport substrate-binding protein